MSNSKYAVKKGQNKPFRGNIGIAMTAEPITALVAMNPFFLPLQNLTPAPVGQVFTSRLIQNLSLLKKTPLFLCVGSRFYAANAMLTSAMYLKMDLNLPAFVIASIPLLWILKNLKTPDRVKKTTFASTITKMDALLFLPS